LRFDSRSSTSRFRRSAERHAVRIECTTFGAWCEARRGRCRATFPRRHAPPHHATARSRHRSSGPCISSPAPAGWRFSSRLSTWGPDTSGTSSVVRRPVSLIDRNLTTQTADVWHGSQRSGSGHWRLANTTAIASATSVSPFRGPTRTNSDRGASGLRPLAVTFAEALRRRQFLSSVHVGSRTRTLTSLRAPTPLGGTPLSWSNCLRRPTSETSDVRAVL